MSTITPDLAAFITAQPLFFVATAPADGRVNLSPKGMDTFRIVDERRVRFLNLTGSGNETAAHVAENGRITIMFCSFDAMPLIVRLYGSATVCHPGDAGWSEAAADFAELGGSRQVFDIAIDDVRTSCGAGVPVMTLTDVRADTELEPFYAEMSTEELHDYWRRKNTISLDGRPTGIDAAWGGR